MRDERSPLRYLNLGWRVMFLWGAGVALLGLVAVFVNHVLSPQILLYTAADERFTGLSWSDIQQTGSRLPLWLTLFYDITALMMVFYGVLTAVVSATAYRRGERWAWFSLLLAFLASSSYLVATAVPFLSLGLLGISGISIGVPGILVILAFLVFGLVLPGLEMRRTPSVLSSTAMKGGWKLSFGWIVLAILFGAFLNIVFAIAVPLTDHVSLPGAPLTYMASDAEFSGVPWDRIVSSSPALSVWIVLQMDNMCARMMGAGILATAVAVKGFRRSERWAYHGLLAATAIWWGGFYLISIPPSQAGITGAGAISLGTPSGPFALFLLFPLLNILAFVLPYRRFRSRSGERAAGK